MSKPSEPNSRSRIKYKWQTTDSIVVGVIILFVASWLLGKQNFTSYIDPFFAKAWPEAESYKLVTESNAEVFDADGNLVGYMAKGSAEGYGGPLTIGVAFDTLGNVQSLAVLEYRETPSFFQKVLKTGLLKKLVKKGVRELGQTKNSFDGVSGATFTYNALTQSVDDAIGKVAHNNFDIEVELEPQPIKFGLPEIVLLALFAVAVIRRKFIKGNLSKQLRWVTLIGGLVFIGFVYNRSFVLTHVNMVLLGYLPDWHIHLYWYILIIGLFLFKTKDNWNTYCYDFCPFGACQEIMAQIGGAKNRQVRWPKLLLWFQRGLAVAAVSMALLFRNPGFSSFEIFGTLFNLNGSSYQFAILAIMLMLSIFVYRPWCRYLCPLHKNTLEGLFDRVRKYVKFVWQFIFFKWKRS